MMIMAQSGVHDMCMSSGKHNIAGADPDTASEKLSLSSTTIKDP